ncbi:MAG: RNA polymerase sigma factor SigZ [Anaerolineales bacterium]|jgi:RNA polymerase sigma-70 factor (ECF subfamily)
MEAETLTTQAIWEQFGEQLRRFILRRVDDPRDAEDILQDVFIKIHTRLETIKEHERLAAWLYQLTRNTIIDSYRTRRPEVPLPDTLMANPAPDEPEAEAQIAAGLKLMVNGLPDKYRQALLLTEFEGMKQTELAERLGISVSGAKSRVQRGRAMLRQELFDCCHFEFDLRGKMIAYTPRPQCCPQCRTA